MLSIFSRPDTALYPRQDEEVIACHTVASEARLKANEAAAAWRQYGIDHIGDVNGCPFPKDKQQLYDSAAETEQAALEAERAHAQALEAATARATAAWNDRIRAELLEDEHIVQAFVDLLRKFEGKAMEANAAGCHAFRLSENFLCADEVAERFRYAKSALGIT